MAYLLRSLLLIKLAGLALVIFQAKGWFSSGYGHIELAIPVFLFTIFAQAFVMFYFIGTARLTENIYRTLDSGAHLKDLFETPPQDIQPYKEKTFRFVQETKVSKRQTIPWTMLMLILGSLAFLLGGAVDTGVASRSVHVGLVYGFVVALLIGFFRQWYYLGKSHLLLRKLKNLFEIPHNSM